MQTHLMIDLETLSTSPHAAILSCGLVAFTANEILDKKEWLLDIDQQLNLGRKIDFSTIKWWMQQSDEARQLFKMGFFMPISTFSQELAQFYNRVCSTNTLIWGNGASFDIPILETLLKKTIGSRPPWKYTNHRCYRTVKQMFQLDSVPFIGVKHSAIADATHQATILQKLFKEKPEVEK